MARVAEDTPAAETGSATENGAHHPAGLPAGEKAGIAASAGGFHVPAWARAGLTVLSLCLALLSGWLVESARVAGALAAPPASWWLFGIAALLLTLATWPAPKLLIAQPPVIAQAAAAMRPDVKRKFNLFRMLAVGCGVGSMALFLPLSRDFENPQVAGNQLVNTGPWVLYIASLLLFAAAFVIWERHAPAAESTGAQARIGHFSDALSAAAERLLVGGLTLVALAVRVWDLGSVPPGLWFDEAQNGTVGRSLLAAGAVHAPFISAYTQMGALYFYLVGIMGQFLGAGAWQVRLLPALFGTLTVPLLYLLASRLFGWRVGLAAAGLLAVSAWNITFSRYGMASMFTVFLDLGVYLLVLRGLRTGRLGYYAGAGVMLGFALQAYYIGRLVPFVLLALLVHLYLTERVRLKAVLRSGAVVFVLGALLSAMPVITFAVEHPEIYNGRVDTVSVFSPSGSEGRQDALQSNLVAHLEMFNFKGDNNARHNLPGAPELDWVVASLFWVGFGTCLLRAWRWQYFFAACWFLVSLSGGVFSVVWEAPHAHRTLENSVVTCLLAGIFFGEILSVLTAVLARGGVRVLGRAIWASRLGMAGGAAILLLVIWAATMDLPRYFTAQAASSQVWLQMGAPDLRAAQDVAEYGPSRDVYLDREYGTIEPYDYLGINVKSAKLWDGPFSLPLPITTTRDVVLALDPSNARDPQLFTRLYPHAALLPLAAPSDPKPLMYTVLIPLSDVKGVYGVSLTVGTGGSPGSTESVIPSAEYTGPAGSGSHEISLQTTLKVSEFGAYAFRWLPDTPNSTEDGVLSLDGVPVSAGQPVTLSVGLHDVRLAEHLSGGQTIHINWLPPHGSWQPIPSGQLLVPQKVVPHGLTGIYRSGSGFIGPIAVERIDPVISFNSEHFPVKIPYTAEWVGKVYAPKSGQYTFGLRQIGRSTLYLDGKKVISNVTDWKITGYAEAGTYLGPGWHDIRIQLDPGVDILRVYLEWTPPGGQHSILPAAYLSPSEDSTPQRVP